MFYLLRKRKGSYYEREWAYLAASYYSRYYWAIYNPSGNNDLLMRNGTGSGMSCIENKFIFIHILYPLSAEA
jgi:hypothetical protein